MVLLKKTLENALLSNTIAVIILRGTTTITRLAVLFIIAQLVIPEEFGMIVFALATVEIAKVIADFGVDMLAIREYAILPARESKQSFASTVATTKIISGMIVYVLVLGVFALGHNPTQTQIGAILGILVLTGLWNNFSITYFQALLVVRQIILPVFIVNIFSIIVILLLLLTKPSILLLVSVLPFVEAISGWMLFKSLERSIGVIRFRAQITSMVGLLRRSLPIAVGTVIVTVYTRMDVIILNKFFDKATVGYYGVAFRLTEPFQFIGIAFAMSIYGHLSAMILADTKRISGYIIRYSVGILAYGLLTCATLLIFAPICIQLFLPNYTPAIPVLRILAIALVFRTFNSCLTSVIRAYGHFTRITIVSAWNFVAIVGLLWIFVPSLGTEGAALALLIGEILNSLVQIIIIQQTLSSTSFLQPIRRLFIHE